MTVQLEIEFNARGERVVAARFPYSEDAVARVKSISGSRWSKATRAWHFPLDLTACAMLRQAFPDLAIGPDLWQWAANEKRNRAQLTDLHRADSADAVDLPLVRTTAPTMWAAMQARGYQTLVPAFAKRVGNYFNASQPGTGKTIETLASLVECEKSGNILVVAPRKAIQSTWPREINKWLAPDASVSILVADSEQGTMAERDALLGQYGHAPGEATFRFVLVHPEMLSWEFGCDYVNPTTNKRCNGKSKTCPKRSSHTKRPLYPSLFQIKWDAVIMDETHKMMMHANERSGSISGWGYGAQKLVTAPGALKIGMSGTPFKGLPRRFWPMLHWLRPDRYTGQRKWETTYFEVESDFWARSGQKVTDKMREDRKQLFNDDLGSIMIRHTKRELAKINSAWAPPEKIHTDVPLVMDPKQRKAYAGMLKDATARLLGGELMANGILAERTRLKQFAIAYGKVSGEEYTPSLPSNKWEWIVNALEERGLAKGMNDGAVKIIIASQYVSMLKMFSEDLTRMGIKHFTIYGQTKNVGAVEDAWQSDQTDTRVLLLSKSAGGTSLTLDAADDLVIVEPAENPDDDEQVEDRVHRTSRTDHQVNIYHLVSEGTIDESIASGNLLMDVTQKAVLDGRRGVEFARLTLEGGKA